VVLKGLRATNVGARGNEDGVKPSGVEDCRGEGCSFERWGAGGGSAADMAGCHRGVVEGCRFSRAEGSNAVQAKGGCSDVEIRRCAFENAGFRGVNIGGSTGLEFFRPPLQEKPFAEARNIRVLGDTFVGSDAPVAFVGADGAEVRFITIYRPRRWALRILQETAAAGFVPCRKGVFSHNIVVSRSDEWREGGVNIEPGTAPASFVFEKNVWFCLDEPSLSAPKLPAEEKDGMRGKDPMLADPEKGDLRLRKGSPAAFAGAEALPK
jgi:hypothetical protein